MHMYNTYIIPCTRITHTSYHAHVFTTVKLENQKTEMPKVTRERWLILHKETPVRLATNFRNVRHVLTKILHINRSEVWNFWAGVVNWQILEHFFVWHGEWQYLTRWLFLLPVYHDYRCIYTLIQRSTSKNSFHRHIRHA